MENCKQASASLLSKLIFTVLTLLTSTFVFAQDKKVDVDINTNSGGGFMSSPWVWVIGAAVFILLLVALMRGGGRKD